MGNDDELASVFVLVNLLDDQVGDQSIVQVVFRLIDDQWLIAIAQQKGQDSGMAIPPASRILSTVSTKPVFVNVC